MRNVVSAGGTSLTTGSVSGYRGFTETAWAGAGSTCNTYLSKPSWQHGACTGRASSDVSADADPNTGLQLYDSAGGGWTQAGGTSLSSPLVAAFEGLVSPSTKTGQWAYNDAALLNDITVGKNEAHGIGSLRQLHHAAGVPLQGAAPATTARRATARSTATSSPAAQASAALTLHREQLWQRLERLRIIGPHRDARRRSRRRSTPTACATGYYWQYGTSTSFGNQTATVTTKGVSGGVSIESILQGLSATTTYYYRLVATNADGTVYGYTFSLHNRCAPRPTRSARA